MYGRTKVLGEVQIHIVVARGEAFGEVLHADGVDDVQGGGARRCQDVLPYQPARGEARRRHLHLCGRAWRFVFGNALELRWRIESGYSTLATINLPRVALTRTLATSLTPASSCPSRHTNLQGAVPPAKAPIHAWVHVRAD